ncbi:N-glycosidase YbiA-like [Ostrea edulis]|uniref:N-glycosidase YbiA-like n=1 Tax=Ostrea edulis TaxID=37623 RepID=UPI0024AF477E|nr:N-glycosidase YbiA-like [Ostrea edulis]
MKIFGAIYPSAEQAFQHVKAMRSADLNKAESISNAETALDAKRIGNQVLVSDAWLDSRDEVMREILESKIKQCEEFRDGLGKIKKTNILAEATWDTYWGTGLNNVGTIHTVMQRWTCQNKLGRMLDNLARQIKFEATERNPSQQHIYVRKVNIQ